VFGVRCAALWPTVTVPGWLSLWLAGWLVYRGELAGCGELWLSCG